MRRGGIIVSLLAVGLLLLEALGYFVVSCDAGPMPQLPQPPTLEVQP